MTRDSDSPKKSSDENELSVKVLYINRCAKVVKGGRKFSFSALILVGDHHGKIGFGFAKANELTDAIRKGEEAAKKNVRTFDTYKTTIPHEVRMQWDGASVLMKPAPEGTGVVAGSHMRAILEMAGIKDVVGKSLGSKNPINLVRATFEALDSLCARETIKECRGN